MPKTISGVEHMISQIFQMIQNSVSLALMVRLYAWTMVKIRFTTHRKEAGHLVAKLFLQMVPSKTLSIPLTVNLVSHHFHKEINNFPK